jgi:UDPglucose 6-dehydrogenase
LGDPAEFTRSEDGMFDLLTNPGEFKLARSVMEMVYDSDVIFVAVQTPHEPHMGGEQPVQQHHVTDFEYHYLQAAVQSIVQASKDLDNKNITIVVVSTCLPGTMNRVIKPLLTWHTHLVYNPFFIAMGTTVHDFINPDFVLVGADDVSEGKSLDATMLRDLYYPIHQRPIKAMSIESAELTKVAYNTFISMKIVFANAIGEICDGTAADADEVIDGLTLATDRVVSAKYMRAGMGDGGHCHPRDNLAMSWLATKLGLSVDVMGFVSIARDAQTGKLAHTVAHWQKMTGLGVSLLGVAYKPNSDLAGGSPALLLSHCLQSHEIAHRMIDPHTNQTDIGWKPVEPLVYVVTTNHDYWRGLTFPAGSVIIDPFGDIQKLPTDNFTLVRPGRK